MTKRILSQVQGAEILRSVHRVTFPDKVRSFEIRRDLNVETLLIRTERSQLR